MVGMVAGSVQQVRIQDPQRLVAIQMTNQKAGAQSPDVSVGVWEDRHAGHTVFPGTYNGNGRPGLDYHVTVPQNMSL